MKKQIVISTLIGVAIWGATAAMVLNTASAKESDNNQGLLANNSSLITTKTPINTQNETVYVMTDENGNTKSKYIGSTLYSGTEELPFTFGITYFLNGQEISAKDLAGKSGHVKIIFNYASTARYQGKYVPFVAITNLVLDHAKFTNLRMTNGKLLHETPDNYIITGFGLAGGNADLGVDILPDNFTFEADTTDFKLEDVYTVFTNDLIADIDLSMLTDLDSVINSIYQLSDGLDKIVNGANELTNGLATALDGTKTLYEGSKTLTNGLSELTSHNEELIAGVSEIKNLTPSIAELMQEKIDSLNEQKDDLKNQKAELEQQLAAIPDLPPYAEARATILAYINQITAGIEQIDTGITKLTTGLSKLPKLNTLYDGIISYTNGVAKAAAGSTTLSNGLGALVEGQTKLYQGAITLRDGLTTFKTSGIDKLVNFAKNDLSRFTNNLRATVRAAGSYKSFGNVEAKSVKFIVKTPSI
ncbi:MAG: hypothetical protein Q4F58_02540 [Candidatus Saccharibacteria bacterium]|nr:hypothetical protein [Candidatus Saccharibacteria bacterium]